MFGARHLQRETFELIRRALENYQKEPVFTDQITITSLLIVDVYFEEPLRLSSGQTVSVRFNLS